MRACAAFEQFKLSGNIEVQCVFPEVKVLEVAMTTSRRVFNAMLTVTVATARTALDSEIYT